MIKLTALDWPLIEKFVLDNTGHHFRTRASDIAVLAEFGIYSTYDINLAYSEKGSIVHWNDDHEFFLYFENPLVETAFRLKYL